MGNEIQLGSILISLGGHFPLVVVSVDERVVRWIPLEGDKVGWRVAAFYPFRVFRFYEVLR